MSSEPGFLAPWLCCVQADSGRKEAVSLVGLPAQTECPWTSVSFA